MNMEKKAVRLVNTDAVGVVYWRTGDDGRIVFAQGVVTSNSHTYRVTVEPDRHMCDCEYGVNRPGRVHSHTRALELAVWKQARKDT